ncbi:hypothetical protein [Natronobiforma cellulositropha]|uniref:hypothetical protein n=1 Tax=Natronobiforma cellulositropha TaxID=1679076 RepID=UPI0021D5B1CC|nr:hypothetical protein [Natronobiforma cellulositropha]
MVNGPVAVTPTTTLSQWGQRGGFHSSPLQRPTSSLIDASPRGRLERVAAGAVIERVSLVAVLERVLLVAVLERLSALVSRPAREAWLEWVRRPDDGQRRHWKNGRFAGCTVRMRGF